MRLPFTLADLRRAPTEVLRRELNQRLEAKYAAHDQGERYPDVTINDWALAAELALRATGKDEER